MNKRQKKWQWYLKNYFFKKTYNFVNEHKRDIEVMIEVNLRMINHSGYEDVFNTTVLEIYKKQLKFYTELIQILETRELRKKKEKKHCMKIIEKYLEELNKMLIKIDKPKEPKNNILVIKRQISNVDKISKNITNI